MFKPFAEMFENVSEACRKAKRTFKYGFRQGAIKTYAETQKKELKKATPRSNKPGKHAADDWEIEYDREMGIIVGFEITNPHDRIDGLEYGVPAHTIFPKKAKVLRYEKDNNIYYGAYVRHPGIKPMGFVREVQDKLNREVPSWVKKFFDKPIERDFK